MGQVISEDFSGFRSSKATILMAAYNAENHIEETLNSIKKQTFKDFNILVVEDGSSDHTLEILKKFEDSRLYILENKVNLRLVNSLNRGLDLIQSQYIIRVDADDILHPQRLEKQIAFMDENEGTHISGTYYKYFGERDNIVKMPIGNHAIKAEILFNSPIAHPTLIYRTEHFKNYKIKYSEEYIHMEDAELWSRIFPYTKFQVLPEVLYFYRWEGQNITSKNADTRKVREERFFEDLYNRLGLELDSEYLRSYVGYRNKRGQDKRGVKKILTFFDKVLEWNKNKKCFDQSSLLYKVSSERKRLFFVSIDQNLTYVFIFWKYPKLIFGNLRYILSSAFKRK